jgi:hypothetical protein
MDGMAGIVVLGNWSLIPNVLAVEFAELLVVHSGIVLEVVDNLVSTTELDSGLGVFHETLFIGASDIVLGVSIDALERGNTHGRTVNTVWIVNEFELVLASHEIVHFLVLVAEDDVVSIDIITGVFEKGVSTSTGIECNLFDKAWDKIPVPGTKVDVFWIRHELFSVGDGRIDNAGAINLWENNLDVIPADEITPAVNSEFEIGGVGSLLALGFEESPWEWDSGSASHIEWAPPDVIEFLCVNTAERNSLWELSWDLSLSITRNCGNEAYRIVNEGGETIDGPASDSLDIRDDEIIE